MKAFLKLKDLNKPDDVFEIKSAGTHLVVIFKLEILNLHLCVTSVCSASLSCKG